MRKREFLGWDQPLYDGVAGWLLSRQDAFAGMCVMVPTSQSGRTLRDRMAESLPDSGLPEFKTPAEWIGTAARGAAPAWMELLAWSAVMDRITDWRPYRPLFPEKPDFPRNSLHTVVHKLCDLGRRLQENGHTFRSAARAMSGTFDADRWECLANLEDQFETTLREWGKTSRTGILARSGHDFLTHKEYVLAGVFDMPPWLAARLRSCPKPVTALIGAPSTHSESFDDLGIPNGLWIHPDIKWPREPHGSVRLAADHSAQAGAVLELLQQNRTPPEEAVVGVADPTLSGAVAKALGNHGWPAFDPSPIPAATGLRRWLRALRAWLAEESVSHLHDLLSMPESGFLSPDEERFEVLQALGKWRDQRLVRTMEDIHRIPLARHGHGTDPQLLQRIASTASSLSNRFRTSPFADAMLACLDAIGGTDPDAAFLRDWIEETRHYLDIAITSPLLWFDLMIHSLPSVSPIPPEGRVMDVSGWLELPYARGNHLVVCGMNHGKVPAIVEGDSWMGERTAERLGLPGNAARTARDSFLTMHLRQSRKRVDWICGKFGAGGTTLLPSGILLRAKGRELAERAEVLFRDIPPSEAGIRKHADWKWVPHGSPMVERISVTALRDWIDCPFRFYIKHIAKIQSTDYDRIEWNHRDFGNWFHDIVESWANDPDARDFDQADVLSQWLAARLDRLVAGRYGGETSLAIRMQTDALRARLHWFAEEQAVLRASGWRTIAAEKKMELPMGGLIVSGKIDRIDQHPEHGIRVIDYKTSAKAKDVVKEHLVSITSNTRYPVHWGDHPPCFVSLGKKEYRWTNLQLPLYAHHLMREHGSMPTPCYIAIGASRKEVKVQPWDDFSKVHLASAIACAEWLVGKIRDREFWPPAGRSLYQDDVIGTLASGFPEEEMFEAIAEWKADS